MAILQTLSDFFTTFLPWKIVHKYEHGIRWTLGRPGRELVREGGVMFYIPFFQDVDVVDGTVGPIHLPPQTITLANGETWEVRVGLEYRVADAGVFICELGDNDDKEVIAIKAGGIICKTLSASYGLTISAEVINELNQELEGYGVEIVSAQLIERAKVRPLKVFLGRESGGQGGP